MKIVTLKSFQGETRGGEKLFIHKRIWELVYGVKRYIISKGIIGIFISATHIMQAILLGRIVGQVYSKKTLTSITFEALLLVVFLFLRILLLWFNQVYGKWIIGKVKNTLRERALAKLIRLGPGYLTQSRTGKLESTIVAGVDYLEGYISLYLPQIFVCIFGSGAMIIYIFTIMPILGVIVLLTSLIALFVPVFFLKYVSKFTEDHWNSYTDLNAEFVDCAQGMVTLKAFNAAERVGKELKKKMNLLFKATMKSLKINLSDVGIAGFAISFGSAFTLALAAYYTAKGSISIANLSVLLFLITEVYRPITELGIYFHQGFMGMTSADDILNLLDEKEHIVDCEVLAPNNDDKKDIAINKRPPRIVFENISFSYSLEDKDRKKLFNNLSFNISAGEKLAIVGESGSGKTSLIKLLMRFYDIDKGSIYYNDINTKDIPLKLLREKISIVSQDTYLFNGTIEENLKLAKPNATSFELDEACKIAHIYDFIRTLKNGYKAFIGERGLNFSGGQRQRIAIARAVLKNAPLIILDEATSSLDAKNENDIQKSLEKLLEGKTALIVAHRLSTIKNADRILVLHAGTIVEEGTHQALMEKGEYYYRLVSAQNVEAV